jgi:hypothetical protein
LLAAEKKKSWWKKQRPSYCPAVNRLFFLAAFATVTTHLHAQTILIDPPSASFLDADAISGGFSRSNLYLTVSFRNGTFNSTNLGFSFGLDTDEDPLTGGHSYYPVGAEFSIYFTSIFSMSEARVYNFALNQIVGTVPVVFGTNSASVTVPLSLLNNDDGLMSFGCGVGNPTGPDSFFEYGYYSR